MIRASRRWPLRAFVVLGVWIGIGCDGDPTAAPSPTRACVRSADCGADELCGFPVTGGCSATGRCLRRVERSCSDDGVPLGVGCDGNVVSRCETSLPLDFASQPLFCAAEEPRCQKLHQPCSVTADCASTTLVCGFSPGDGCAAKGRCVPSEPKQGCPELARNFLGCGCNGEAVRPVGVCAGGAPEAYGDAPLAQELPGLAGPPECTPAGP